MSTPIYTSASFKAATPLSPTRQCLGLAFDLADGQVVCLALDHHALSQLRAAINADSKPARWVHVKFTGDANRAGSSSAPGLGPQGEGGA